MKHIKIAVLAALVAIAPSISSAFSMVVPTQNAETRVVAQPSQLMVDGFDSLDTTNRWNTATVSGAGNTLTVASGNLLATLGASVGYAYTTSRNSFQDVTPGQLRFAFNVKLEATPKLGTYRFFGAGTPKAAPTTVGCPAACSNTMQEGIGFEVNTDGIMYAVTYKAGVRESIATLEVPTDGLTHNYSVFYRPVKSHWFIDTQEAVAVSSLEQSALVLDSFPVSYLAVQGSNKPAVLSSNTMSVSDTANNNTVLSDGVFGFRKATVKGASTSAGVADTALVVSAHPVGGNPCQNPTATLGNLQGTTTGTSSVQLLAPVGSQKIHVCSATVVSVSGTAPTFSLTYGTGTACSTGTGVLLPAIATAGTAGILYPMTTPLGVTPASNALCYVQTGTTPIVKYNITYIQQ